jgi:flagellar biosynthesis/type III secretory pathway protein FliH
MRDKIKQILREGDFEWTEHGDRESSIEAYFDRYTSDWAGGWYDTMEPFLAQLDVHQQKEFIEQLGAMLEEAHDYGNESGREGGWDDGYSDGHSEGYDEGHTDGYDSGYDDAQSEKDCEDECNDAWHRGYEEGQEEKDCDDERVDAHEEGRQEGYEEGCEECGED